MFVTLLVLEYERLVFFIRVMECNSALSVKNQARTIVQNRCCEQVKIHNPKVLLKYVLPQNKQIYLPQYL